MSYTFMRMQMVNSRLNYVTQNMKFRALEIHKTKWTIISTYFQGIPA